MQRTIKRVKLTVSWHFARCIFSSPFSSLFLTLARSPLTSPSLLHLSASQSTATLQGWLCFGRLAEQPLLPQVTNPSLSSKSAASTPRSTSRTGSLDKKTSTISATKVGALEMLNTSDLGRLTSSLLSQERQVSAFPFSVSRISAHSNVKRSTRGR